MPTTVLVIEDEPELRDTIVDYLMYKGYRVAGAGTLAEATEALSIEVPDLVLSDIGLPDGDGVSFCMENARRFPRAKWILMSGHRDLVQLGHDARDIAAMPAFAIVDKPVSMRLLEGILQQRAPRPSRVPSLRR